MSIFSISFSFSYATTGKALFSLMCQNFIHCSMFLPVCFQRIPDQIACVDVSFLTISLIFRTNSTVLGCAGFHGDCLTLTKVITARLQMYEHEHGSKMSCPAIAQMLSTELYYRRFFPYYTYNILAGLDSEGKGCVYSFDPVGSYERETYRAGGSASSLLQPLLDNQIGFKNQQGVTEVPLTKDKAVFLVKDVFTAAAERDIYTGDAVIISVITIDGTTEEVFPLRRD
ncbi:proteasome subunit beta type-1-B-like isoform X2 [Acropora muricata]|uniref:proteasome subunit beta type-1-B-like isoform X2 n=1 Tax=Acropora muricata TaxID=159855 RepID=UPI0034E4A7B7